MGEIILVRHGETEWSRAHRHTSITDLPLTEVGEAQAGALAQALAGRRFAAVLCSPRRRARRTAELAGLAVTETVPDVAEWDYGQDEGLTTREIRAARPNWLLWTDGCPGGESPAQVGARVDRVLARIRPLLTTTTGTHGTGASAGSDVALVAHGHVLRVLAARWIGLPPTCGQLLRLDTATLSTLGFEHERPAILRWNAPTPPVVIMK